MWVNVYSTKSDFGAIELVNIKDKTEFHGKLKLLGNFSL